MKKILVTGLCTLHWGRLQYGNIGNYYIIEPLFRQLHRVFPNYEITTTFQMTKEFVEKEQIVVLPMEMYYAWIPSDLENAKNEFELAKKYKNSIPEDKKTSFIRCIEESELVINVSGDMWGDNAEHVGHARFMVDLYKMRIAQLLEKKTVLFAGTPGPFSNNEIRQFAQEVYANFNLVINREPTSTLNMKKWNFFSGNVKDFACPAFLFEPELTIEELETVRNIIKKVRGKNDKALIGFTIGGFNMPVGPYDMWPREDAQYDVFVRAIEEMIQRYDVKIVLFSHTNGFKLPPEFELINGRDYIILKQLEEIVLKRGNVPKESIVCLEEPYLPHMIKKIIGQFDMVITGRVHASVAAISQCVPTVFINYEENFIPSTKMYGFSSLCGVNEFVCVPREFEQMLEKISLCYENRNTVRSRLEKRIPEVKVLAEKAFDEIREITDM